MPQIQGFRIRNYKALKDVTFGKLWNNSDIPLTPLTVVIGKNGSGKSSIFEAFGFIADCLKAGVEDACDVRGGFEKIFSKGQNIDEPMAFELYYRESAEESPITYEFSIKLDKNHRPFVFTERLRQRRKGQRYGQPFSFLVLNDGVGIAWKGKTSGTQITEDENSVFDINPLISKIESGIQTEETNETEVVRLNDNRHLAITTLGALKQHPRITAFRKFIEGWYVSYFSPDSARALPLAGVQKHLDVHGDNVANVVQFMQREHPKRFKGILERIAKKIPGLEKIDTEISSDGRLLLKFYGQGFKEPFYAQQMSDGTLKMFTYMLLMEDPEPHSFICIEEPENGLYHRLLEILAAEFREHAAEKKSGSQLFITTHQPYFVNALEPDEVWILEKQADGFSAIHRASDDTLVKDMVAEGIPLGSLWYSEYLDKD